MPSIVPSLWFPLNLQEALDFYTGLFPDSEVLGTASYGPGGHLPEGTLLSADFTLMGRTFNGINAEQHHDFNDAVSFLLLVEDQAELDLYWEALTADGGQEVQCGWCKDKFGLSWQVVPRGWMQTMTQERSPATDRAFAAIMGMVKIDIAAVQAAYDGDSTATPSTDEDAR